MTGVMTGPVADMATSIAITIEIIIGAIAIIAGTTVLATGAAADTADMTVAVGPNGVIITRSASAGNSRPLLARRIANR